MSVDSDIGPFAIVPEWVLRAVSPQAVVLFAELALHADRKTAKAWPSRARLAERLNVTTKTIDRSLKELVDIDAIEKHARRDDSGWHSSLYLVKYASLPSVTHVPTPSPTDVPQNQNHFEPEPKNQKEQELSTLSLRDDFERFYASFPSARKGAKRPVHKAWDQALHRGADPSDILAGAVRFRDDPNRVDAFTPGAAAWLNRDGWEEPLLPVRSRPKRVSQATELMRRAMEG